MNNELAIETLEIEEPITKRDPLRKDPQIALVRYSLLAWLCLQLLLIIMYFIWLLTMMKPAIVQTQGYPSSPYMEKLSIRMLPTGTSLIYVIAYISVVITYRESGILIFAFLSISRLIGSVIYLVGTLHSFSEKIRIILYVTIYFSYAIVFFLTSEIAIITYSFRLAKLIKTLKSSRRLNTV